MTVVSSFLTFPNISWWMDIVIADVVMLDSAERFQKMSYRNRYRISSANNPVLLTVPLVNGRSQHVPVGEVLIHNETDWQTRHWRTLVSAYKRSPYFDYYEDSLRYLFETEFARLADFNEATIDWVRRQLKIKLVIEQTAIFRKEYPPDITDLRNVSRKRGELPIYRQVFEDRHGFIPDLCILDLLFSEGPDTSGRLKQVTPL